MESVFCIRDFERPLEGQRVMFSGRPDIDWRELFGNPHPVEIEIGSGKGAFLIAAARASPDVNFLGIEIQPRWVRLTEERIRRRAAPNARVICADALVVLREFVPSASVRALHVYFPDPWWKRRHEKRRLVTPEFADVAWRILAPEGRLHLSTDVPERFEAMLDALTSADFEVRRFRETPTGIRTNFEEKYRREGRAIAYATLVKPPVTRTG